MRDKSLFWHLAEYSKNINAYLPNSRGERLLEKNSVCFILQWGKVHTCMKKYIYFEKLLSWNYKSLLVFGCASWYGHLYGEHLNLMTPWTRNLWPMHHFLYHVHILTWTLRSGKICHSFTCLPQLKCQQTRVPFRSVYHKGHNRRAPALRCASELNRHSTRLDAQFNFSFTKETFVWTSIRINETFLTVVYEGDSFYI